MSPGARVKRVEEAAPGASEEARTLRALRVLEVIAESSLPISLPQLGLRTHIPKATLSRLVASLIGGGYVSMLPGRHELVPGPAAALLGLCTLGNGRFRRECRAVLRNVVTRLGETCNVTVRDGDLVTYIERVESDQPLRLHLEPGTRAPLHCTAGGKLFLAQLDDAEQDRLLKILTLKRITPATITQPDALRSELRRLRMLGIGVDNEEFVVGMVGLAVPIQTGEGTILGALVCHAAAARVSLSKLEMQTPLMRTAAKALADLFGMNTASSK